MRNACHLLTESHFTLESLFLSYFLIPYPPPSYLSHHRTQKFASIYTAFKKHKHIGRGVTKYISQDANESPKTVHWMVSLESKTCEKVPNVSDKKCEVLVRADIVCVQPSGARRLLNVDDCPVHSLYNLFTGLLHFWPYSIPVFDVWERIQPCGIRSSFFPTLLFTWLIDSAGLRTHSFFLSFFLSYIINRCVPP